MFKEGLPVLMAGALSDNGDVWFLNESRKSCVGDKGFHLTLSAIKLDPQTDPKILIGSDSAKFDPVNSDNLNGEVKKDLMAVAMELQPELAKRFSIPEDRFRIVLNGVGLGTRPTFHIHIVLVKPEVDVMRVVDSIVVPSE